LANKNIETDCISVLTEQTKAVVEAAPTETVTMGTTTETKEVTATVETSTVESEKKEATTA
jgi:Fe-S-cluster-containing hydrogenase component 2